jgi:pilus assembly protein Flp/PilA
MRRGRSLFRDQKGATSVEYGLMIAAVAAILLAILQLVGERLNTARTSMGDPTATGSKTPDGGFLLHGHPDQP